MESNRTIQPATKSVPPPSCKVSATARHLFAYFSRASRRGVPTKLSKFFGRIQDPAAILSIPGTEPMHCLPCALCLKCVKQFPSARIEKPCDHKESQKSSVDAHIDSQSRMLRHTPHASPTIIAISYISYHGESSSPTAASAQSMSIENNTSSISGLNFPFRPLLERIPTHAVDDQ